MNSKNRSDDWTDVADPNSKSRSAKSDASVGAEEWTQHEHISEHVQLEAMKLIEEAGSPELAKKAIDVMEDRLSATPPSHQLPDTRTISNDPFLESLAQFEKAVQTPLVPGELSDWLSITKQLLDQVGGILYSDVRPKHSKVFRAISSQDSALVAQVDKLRKTDHQLLIDFENVKQDLERVVQISQAAMLDEQKVVQRSERIVRDGLAFVIKARTQAVAIETWFAEAFYRDVGVGD